MNACVCCPGPNATIRELLDFNALPREYQPLPPERGVTYEPRTIPEVSPVGGVLGIAAKWQRDLAYWWLTLMRASYAPTSIWPTRALNALKPTSQVVFTPNAGGLTPGWFAGVFDDGVVVVVSGTSNVVQAMNYILTHAANRNGGPTWTVNAAWWAAAQAILPAVSALAQPASKFMFFMGHSYGAAVAATTLALLPQAQVAGKAGLVLAGSPAYGSDAFCAANANVTVLRLSNVGDPVPYLPPPSLAGYATSVSAPNFRLNAGSYRHCQPTVLLRENGSYAGAGFEEQDPGVWFQAAMGFLMNDPTNIIAHKVSEYVRRARLNIPVIPSPFLENWAAFTDLLALNDEMTAAGF